MDIKQSKNRFGIIGNDLKLNQAINVALQVAATDISVLINGESGTGKETIPQISPLIKTEISVAATCNATLIA